LGTGIFHGVSDHGHEVDHLSEIDKGETVLPKDKGLKLNLSHHDANPRFHLSGLSFQENMDTQAPG
jgi:hypothetical protein